MAASLSLCILCICAALLISSEAKIVRKSKSQPKADPIISILLKQIQASQVKEDVPNYKPPLGWTKVKGSWPAETRLNFHGNPAFALLRDEAYAYDNDAFVTGWLLQMLLETVQYGGISNFPSIKDDLTDMTTAALLAFDKYRDQVRMQFKTEARVPSSSDILLFSCDGPPWQVALINDSKHEEQNLLQSESMQISEKTKLRKNN